MTSTPSSSKSEPPSSKTRIGRGPFAFSECNFPHRWVGRSAGDRSLQCSAFFKDAFTNRWVGHSAGDQPSRTKAPCAALLLLCASLAALPACKNNPSPPPPPAIETKASPATRLKLQTPSAGWTLEPLSVLATGEAYLCLSRLLPPDGMASSVISTIELEITLSQPADPLPFRHYVLGKTWKWNGNPEVSFIESIEEFEALASGAKRLEFMIP